MAEHARLKNEFTEDERCHNLMSWPIFLRDGCVFFGPEYIIGPVVTLSVCKSLNFKWSLVHKRHKYSRH